MSSPYITDQVRLQFDLLSHDAASDLLRPEGIQLWRGADWRIDVGALLGATTIADVSQWASLLLRILPQDQLTASPLISANLNGPFSAINLTDWQSGAAQHARFDIARGNTAFNSLFTTGVLSATVSLVISGLTSETTPKTFVVGVTKIEVVEAGLEAI